MVLNCSASLTGWHAVYAGTIVGSDGDSRGQWRPSKLPILCRGCRRQSRRFWERRGSSDQLRKSARCVNAGRTCCKFDAGCAGWSTRLRRVVAHGAHLCVPAYACVPDAIRELRDAAQLRLHRDVVVVADKLKRASRRQTDHVRVLESETGKVLQSAKEHQVRGLTQLFGRIVQSQLHSPDIYPGNFGKCSNQDRGRCGHTEPQRDLLAAAQDFLCCRTEQGAPSQKLVAAAACVVSLHPYANTNHVKLYSTDT